VTYPEVVEYLYTRLPMFTRTGPAAYKEGLGNIVAISERLDDPHTRYPTIHVAGTNGKGSTSHMLAAVLQRCGYKTGLYTSPHLKDFRERIRVNGQMMPEQRVVDFVDSNKTWFEPLEPSFFELTTGMAFKHFADERVDVAVIETGLGGRLDSTNIVQPVLSVITNISWDHKDLLGDSLQKIATEKAGIIKRNTPVILSENQSVKNVFVEKAKEENAPLLFADEAYRFEERHYLAGLQLLTYRTEGGDVTYQTDLPGYYQTHNVAAVLTACDALRSLGYDIDDVRQRYGLSHVKHLTGLRGRWEILNDNPLTIADVGHNEAGLRCVLNQLQSYGKQRLHFVLGFVKDKDIGVILRMFPRNASYYFCKPDLPRGLDAEELSERARENGLVGRPYASVTKAYRRAYLAASEDDLIFIGGSTFVVAEVL